ncbi:MAG TPA: crosslink repair DNA glycosylase YcaQ family protein, partial [Thermomicrobiales bacterium]
ARDFMDDDDRTPMEYGWGTTRRSQVALQTLLRRGFLMVHHREGTQRFYELTERMLPPAVDVTPVSEGERELHFARRDVTYAGLAMGIGGIKPAVAAGDAVPVAVEGVRATFYIAPTHRDYLPSVAPITEAERRAVMLAPLDPFVWDRRRLAALWGFDYTWEVYVPAAKRKYGPYTLPVLWGDRFVARLDPSLDRKNRVLRVRNLWFEDDAPRDPQLFTDLAAEIARFATFHGDVAVALGIVAPTTRDKRLRAALSRVTTLMKI